VHATVLKRIVGPKCIPKPFIPGAPCDTVHDVLAPQPFQDSITTAPPTNRAPNSILDSELRVYKIFQTHKDTVQTQTQSQTQKEEGRICKFSILE
jgi:hypothetical protein